MGTSCLTILQNKVASGFDDRTLYQVPDGYREEGVCCIYRHFDGYLEGHGKDILDALVEASDTPPRKIMITGTECNKLNNRNWMQHFLKNLCASDADLEFLPAEDAKYFSTNFTYIITGDYANYGCKLELTKDEYLDRITVAVYGYNGEIFYGTAKEYISEFGNLHDGY